MFNLIDRYIARQIIMASIFVLLLFAILQSAFSFLDELSKTGIENYQVSDAVLYVWLMLPSRILTLFPMAVLIGALFGLGNMASNSELTVLRAAGMTTWRIAGSAIKASLILMLMVVFISEFIAPYATKSAQQLKVSALSGGGLSLSKSGLWAKRKNEILQIGNLIGDDQIRELTIYQLTEGNRLKAIIKADSAAKFDDQWQLNQVTEIQFLSDSIKTTEQVNRIWVNPLESEQLNTLILEPEALDIVGLMRYLDYLKTNNLETNIFQLALWRKLLQPLVIAVMIFLAVSFVFGPMRDVSIGAKILSGVMLGFAFHITSQSFGPFSLVFNLWPIIGAATPLMLFTLIGYWLMKKNS